MITKATDHVASMKRGGNQSSDQPSEPVIMITTSDGKPLYRTRSITKAHTFITNHCIAKGVGYDFYTEVAGNSG